ncbi:hypothetical protein [Rhodococcus sp. NPDC127528]
MSWGVVAAVRNVIGEMVARVKLAAQIDDLPPGDGTAPWPAGRDGDT